MLGGVKAERDHERTGREGADGLFRHLERGEIAVVPGAERQGNIEVGAETSAGAALMGIAPEIGIIRGRVGMDRDGEDIAPFVEDTFVPLPWWTSTSRIATRSCFSRRWAAATALLLRKQTAGDIAKA